jgi:hypothetical protein
MQCTRVRPIPKDYIEYNEISKKGIRATNAYMDAVHINASSVTGSTKKSGLAK